MNDFFSDPKTFIQLLLLVLMAVFSWIGKNAMKRLEHLESDTLRKSDLARMEERQAARHLENSGRLDRIEGSVTGTHKRIDDIFTELLKK